jgi:hypothetical protein
MKTDEEDKTEFIVSDLNQAAYVLALNHPLIRAEGQTGSRHFFIFPSNAADDARRFYQGGMINARAFANALRDLKAIIHSR